MVAYPVIASFLRKFFTRQPEDKRILILGLDCAGKTTLLYRLARSEVITTIPTIGFNVETVRIALSNGRSLAVTGWDVGGCDQIRPLWMHYFAGTSGVIFMIDAQDHDRLVEAVEEMHYMRTQFTQPPNDGIIPPFLVFANKQDLPSVLTPESIREKLLTRNPEAPDTIRVFPLQANGPSALFSKNTDEAFTWFEDAIRRQTMIQPPQTTDYAEMPKKPIMSKFVADPRSPDLLAERLESWVSRAQSDCDPDTFLEQFHNYKLPVWDHYTHIRLAHIILRKYGRQKGKNMIFDGIEAYIRNSTQTASRTFHVTMTYFWIQMVHHAIVSMDHFAGEQVVDEFTAFLIFNPHLCDGMLWSDYYEKDTIMTPAAKEHMVLPDRKALPNVVQREVPGKKSDKVR